MATNAPIVPADLEGLRRIAAGALNPVVRRQDATPAAGWREPYQSLQEGAKEAIDYLRGLTAGEPWQDDARLDAAKFLIEQSLKLVGPADPWMAWPKED